MTDEAAEQRLREKTQGELDAAKREVQKLADTIPPQVHAALVPALLKLRLDLLTNYVFTVFEKIATFTDARLAFERDWEREYANQLEQVKEQLFNKDLATPQSGLVVPGHE